MTKISQKLIQPCSNHIFEQFKDFRRSKHQNLIKYKQISFKQVFKPNKCDIQMYGIKNDSLRE